MLVLDRPSRPFLQSFTAVAFEEVVLVDSKPAQAFIFDDDLFFTSHRGVAPSGMNVV